MSHAIQSKFDALDNAREVLRAAEEELHSGSILFAKSLIASRIPEQTVFTPPEEPFTEPQLNSLKEKRDDATLAMRQSLHALWAAKSDAFADEDEEAKAIVTARARADRDKKLAAINKWNGVDAYELKLMLTDYLQDCYQLGFSFEASRKKIKPKSLLPDFAKAAGKSDANFITIDAKGTALSYKADWVIEAIILDQADAPPEHIEIARHKIANLIGARVLHKAQSTVDKMKQIAPLSRWRKMCFDALLVFDPDFVARSEEIATFCAEMMEMHVDVPPAKSALELHAK